MDDKNIIDELLLDDLIDEIVYEDDFRIVKKVIGDINSGNHIKKRVSKVIWKKTNSDMPNIDIRVFDAQKNAYYKGISFSQYEAKELYEILKKYFEEKE